MARNRPSPILHVNRCLTYSRTCPVRLTHPEVNRKIVGIAIIDDQSARILIETEAAQRLRLPSHLLMPDMLATSTVQGDSLPTPCQVVQGLQISSLEGNTKINLSPASIQYLLHNAIYNLSYPDDVDMFPGLREYAKFFPRKTRIGRHSSSLSETAL